MLPGEDDVRFRLIVGDSKAFIDQMITDEFDVGANFNRSVEMGEIDHWIIIGRGSTFICSSCLCQWTKILS
jgi:hypothetical protein